MKVNIFLMCYNESLLLPLTLKHYRDRLPSARFVLVDNMSTDQSREIAKENNVEIRQYESGDKQCEEVMMTIRNTIWNDVKDGWVMMVDMDEWLEITEKQLEEEEKKGTTIITTKGVNVVGNSHTTDLSDIDLFELKEGVYDENFSKRVLFKVPDVTIHFWWGAHKCFPKGNIHYSENMYLLKHMNFLGEEYLIEKHIKRYARNEVMRYRGMNGHYLHEKDKIISIFRSIYDQRVLL